MTTTNGSLPLRLFTAIIVPLIAIYFIFVAVMSLSDRMTTMIPLLSVLGFALAFSGVRKWLANHTPLRIQGWHLLLVLVGIVVVQCIFLATAPRPPRPPTTAALAEQAQQARAKVGEADSAYFAANRQQVLEIVANHKKAGAHTAVLDVVRRYDPKGQDLDMKAARIAAAGELAHVTLKDEKALTVAQRATAYQALSLAEPANKQYANKAASLTAQHKKEREAAARDLAAKELKAARAKALESQFSKWNGSHRALERAVKSTMKNPNSYEHVETRYTDLGRGMRVSTVFRGTNSFGAIVPSRVLAIIDDEGKIVSMVNGQ